MTKERGDEYVELFRSKVGTEIVKELLGFSARRSDGAAEVEE